MQKMSEATEEDEGRRRLEEAYREKRGGLLAWARKRISDAASAEDVLQDAFLGALANANALAFVEDIGAWLLVSMRNRISDLWRREDAKRRAGVVEIPAEVFEEIASEAGYDPSDSLVREELLAALEVAIEALPEKQREALIAQAYEGKTFREIARRNGEPVDTVAARKRYAIRKLAAALEYWMDFEA